MTWVNRFLETLSPTDVDLLRPKLVRDQLRTGVCLVSRGDSVDTVYLPIDCIISVVTTMKSGANIESRTIGRESGFGLLHALGSRYAYERVEVQVSGEAWRIPTGDLAAAATQSPTLTRVIIQHAQATLAQAAQTAACNALHAVKQRLCRWLLMTSDRLGSDVTPLTQEHLSIMLGVQRTTVTAIASELQAQGLIRYSRGRIQLLDLDRMRKCTCECYEAVERDVARILPGELVAY